MTKNKLRSLIAGSVLLSLFSCSLLFTLPASSLDRITANLDQAQTLINKTLTEPIIATIRNTGLLTLPTSTDTLVGRATTDTLTNKTLVSPAITTSSIVTSTNAPVLALNTTSGSNKESFFSFLANGATQWIIGNDLSVGNIKEFGISDGTLRLTINSSGVLDVKSGNIKFPASQNASADANTLDDYEEGTWTPSLGGNTTYTQQVGTYTKIGRKVTVSASVTVNVLGTGSTSTFTGLPFTVNASNNAIGAVLFSSLSTNVVTLVARATASGTSVHLYSQAAAGASLGLNAVLGNSSVIQFTIEYIV